MGAFRSFGVLVGLTVALIGGANKIAIRQVHNEERRCWCVCSQIDNLLVDIDRNTVGFAGPFLSLPGTRVAKRTVWFGSPIICVLPTDPDPIGHLERLQDEANRWANAPESLFSFKGR